jgi:hypothetical protein
MALGDCVQLQSLRVDGFASLQPSGWEPRPLARHIRALAVSEKQLSPWCVPHLAVGQLFGLVLACPALRCLDCYLLLTSCALNESTETRSPKFNYWELPFILCVNPCATPSGRGCCRLTLGATSMKPLVAQLAHGHLFGPSLPPRVGRSGPGGVAVHFACRRFAKTTKHPLYIRHSLLHSIGVNLLFSRELWRSF